MGPVATGFADGKLFRNHPLFTFDSILCNGKHRELGANVSGVTAKGTTFCGKITSIFIYRKHENSVGCIALYLKEYAVLQDMKFTNQEDKDLQSASTFPLTTVGFDLVPSETLIKGFLEGSLYGLSSTSKVPVQGGEASARSRSVASSRVVHCDRRLSACSRVSVPGQTQNIPEKSEN